MYLSRVLLETSHADSCSAADRSISVRRAHWTRHSLTASTRKRSVVLSDLMAGNRLRKPCVVELVQALVPRHRYLFLISARSQVRGTLQRVPAAVFQGEGDHLAMGPGGGH